MRTLLLLSALTAAAHAADPPRARPPEFTDEDRAAFFDDAFATLVGERPEPAAHADPRVEVAVREPAAAAAGWADLIAPDVLETEIKRQAQRLAKATRSASAFKAGGYLDAVDSLGLVATWFAVTTDHKDQPRWRDRAAGLRDLFAEGAEQADAASDAGHAAAAARSGDLSDLIRGGRPSTPEPAQSVDWSLLASRSTLMRRMAAAEEERLGPWIADERSLRRNAEDARHEAQVLAALAEAIVQPGADDGEDEDYQAYAGQLREAAKRLAAAAEAEEQPAAAEAMTAVSRSCVDCHADYRG